MILRLFTDLLRPAFIDSIKRKVRRHELPHATSMDTAGSSVESGARSKYRGLVTSIHLLDKAVKLAVTFHLHGRAWQ